MRKTRKLRATTWALLGAFLGTLPGAPAAIAAPEGERVVKGKAEFEPSPEWARYPRFRSAPDPDATEVGNLWKGDVASASSQDHADDGSGWLLLDESGGWIPTVVGGVEQVRRYEYPRYRSSGWVDKIVAGPDGFVASVIPPGGGHPAVGQARRIP